MPRLISIMLLALLLVAVRGFPEAESRLASQDLSDDEKIVVLREFYEGRLVGLESLQSIFPPSWLAEDFRPDKDKSILEQKENVSSQENQQLVDLKIRWLHFSDSERKGLIDEAQSKEVVKSTKEEAAKTLEKARIDARLQNRNLQTVDRALAASENEREKRLLNILLEIEKGFEWLTDKNREMGEVQATLAESIAEWQQVSREISYALEDENFIPGAQDFRSYRKQLRRRLEESNSAVRSEERFQEYYFKTKVFEKPPAFNHSVQVRDGDTEKIRTLVNSIQQKRVEMLGKLAEYDMARHALNSQLLGWQTRYRREIFELRGKLIEQVIAESAFALNSAEPVSVELDSVLSSITYYFWSRDNVKGKNSNNKKLLTFGLISHLTKILALTALIGWLFLKRQNILKAALIWSLKHVKTRRSIRLVRGLFQLIANLYIFIILLFLGQLFVDFMVGLGFTTANHLAPVMRHILVFFLLLGIINFISPLLSQREQRAQGKLVEVNAMETVFEFLPKLYLYYWLISGVVSIVLIQYLQENLLRFYLVSFIGFSFMLGLFISIWIKRERWRLINERATHSDFWHSLAERSKGKFWEPLVLLLGGGLGVYRVAWEMLLDRLAEMEIARSFQAMVSRAILERQYRKSATKLDPAWFPEKYWRAFNYLTPAEPGWYIDREDVEQALTEAYEEWETRKKPVRVLICGDRGVGKSELIANFFRKHSIVAQHGNLLIGDTHVSDVYSRIGEALLDDNTIKDGEVLIQKILALPSQVLCIENIENSLLRRVGGFDAFAHILDLLVRTSQKHFWIVTCTSYAWSIARRGLVGAESFTDSLFLSGMAEGQLKQMLLNRHEDSSVNTPDFSQLEFGEKSKLSRRKYSKEQSDEKGLDLYFRILWDYTKGNPRQALYYWKASLAWEGDLTSVRLFEVPEQRVLENLSDNTLMLLAALIEHNGLTIDGLAEIMNIPVTIVRRRIEELAPYGIVFSTQYDDKSGWHVESFWTRAVENYLEKRQFLFRGGNL